VSILSDCNSTIISDLQHKEDYLYAFKNHHGHTLKIDPLDSIVEERWGITGEEFYDKAKIAAFELKCYNKTQEGGSYKIRFLEFRHFARKAVKFKKRLPQIHAEMEKRHVRIKWHYNDKDDRNHSDFYRYDSLECFRECKFCKTPEIYEGDEDDDDDDDDDDAADAAAASSSGGGFMKNDFDAKSSAEARSKTANGNGKDDDDDDIGDGSRGGNSYFFNEEDDEEAEWACPDANDEDDREKKRQRKNGDNATHDENEKQQRKRQRDNGGDADHDDIGNRN
jgi:hypothetical protein